MRTQLSRTTPLLLAILAGACNQPSTSPILDTCDRSPYPCMPPGPDPDPVTPNGLWIPSGSSGEILRLAREEVPEDGARIPATVVTASNDRLGTLIGVAFGPDGTMWLASAEEDRLVAFRPEALLSSGSHPPAVVITLSEAATSFPTGLAFDAAGRLWVANNTAGTLVRLDPAQLATSGSPTPAVVLTGIGHPLGLAFDPAGNLWVTDAGQDEVREYAAEALVASGNPTPEVVLTAIDNSLAHPGGLAFDAAGTLWVANLFRNTISAFGPAALARGGAVHPDVQLLSTIGLFSSPTSLAFDGDGALWITGGVGTVTRIPPTDLLASGTPTQATRVTLAPRSTFWSAAFWPIPPALPLGRGTTHYE